MHMFDYCRAELDFKNLEHLACTEIRAASLFHCSLRESLIYSEITPFGVFNGMKSFLFFIYKF